MKTEIMSFNGMNSVGLYGLAADKYVLVGQEVREETTKELEKIFSMPVYRITIAGTSLIGVFLNYANGKLLVPSIAFESELKKLDKLGIDFEVIDTKYTCLGNNMLFGEKEGIVNPNYSESFTRKLGEKLGIKLHRMKISGIESVGSICVVGSGKGVVSNDISEEEFEEMQKILGVELTPGTINMGSEYIKSGLLVNKNGLIIGKGSGGPEIANADQAFRN